MHTIAVLYWIALYLAIIGIAVRFYVLAVRTTARATKWWCVAGTTIILLLTVLLLPIPAAYMLGVTLGRFVGTPVTAPVAFVLACLVAILATSALALALQQGSYKLVKWLAT